ncbi:MAG: Eco57I restriction-modification methylase domain-containing protein [Planctomycetota bacterium]
MTFDYEPEELGLDAKITAKIDSIKQLRPMAPRQPWGIFFVKFEPRRLPVVALRRILSKVVIKKRASANRAERAAWSTDDLLFVSNYGEGEERRISFAHFSQAESRHDLPTLKVLGWDNLDTALHLDHVAETLTTRLAWPSDEEDADAWRNSWRAAFTLRHREVIATSRDLSIRLAELACAIRDRIKTALAIEIETGPLTKLMKAFQEALVHDLDADGFADMYAQTIAYGLLSARIADPEKKTDDDFASQMRTNPFLRDLMEAFLRVGGRRGKAGRTGIDFDELGVSEVVELLDDANMEAVVRDFGDRNPQEDPVIHFYEHFLAAYDRRQKVQRGVFYTPRPVVSYIVRSVDDLLRTEFGLQDGLADTTTWSEMVKQRKGLKIPEGVSPDQAFVQILDPATGTGTFLVEVIDTIYRTLKEKWEEEAGGPLLANVQERWNEYVPEHLLPRLHGYELLMAPYAIAHLKIGLKLYETGYRFGSDERARVYLTNALEPAQDFSGTLAFAIPALAHEARAVNMIKRNRNFTVIIGNPPYSVKSQNMHVEWITRDILSSYVHRYHIDKEERRTAPLQDDYVKFFRFSQWLLDTCHVFNRGILALISNNGFINNPLFRGMRQSLMESFDRIDILNLFGDQLDNDANVFDITTGVCISFLRKGGMTGCQVHYNDELLGQSRAQKYSFLSTSSFVQARPKNSLVHPRKKWFMFDRTSFSEQSEYDNYASIVDLFCIGQLGFMTGNDALFLDLDRNSLIRKITLSLSATNGALSIQDIEAELKKKHGVTFSRNFPIQRINGTAAYLPTL